MEYSSKCLLWEGGFVGRLSIMVEMLRCAFTAFGALSDEFVVDECFD